MKPVFKKSFKDYFKKLLGDELDSFIEVCKKPLKDSIRVNTNKTTLIKVKKLLKKKGWVFEPISFYKNGLIINKRNMSMGNTLEHYMGYYYVQEQSSMIPPIVLNPDEDDFVLDCCASPGSKTTQLSMMMNNKGVIYANDKDFNRISILRNNLQRCGCRNTVITMHDAVKFKNYFEVFDKILLDAPCTGFGAIRKDWSILKMFNPKTFDYMSGVQKKLADACIAALKPGGTLVYSTCTLTTEENEEVVKYVLDSYPNTILEKINIKGLKCEQGIGVDKVCRIWPHHIDMEGFFIAKIKKE